MSLSEHFVNVTALRLVHVSRANKVSISEKLEECEIVEPARSIACVWLGKVGRADLEK